MNNQKLIEHEREVNQLLSLALPIIFIFFIPILRLAVGANLMRDATLVIAAGVMFSLRWLNQTEYFYFNKYLNSLTYVIVFLMITFFLPEGGAQGVPFMCFLYLSAVTFYFQQGIIYFYSGLTILGNGIAGTVFKQVYLANFDIKTWGFISLIFIVATMLASLMRKKAASLMLKAFRKEQKATRLADQLNDLFVESKQVTEEVSAISQQLSSAAEEGDRTIQNVSKRLENMSANIEQISASTQEVTSFAEESSSQTQVGRENIDQVIQRMREISQAVKGTVEVINTLDSNIQEIGEIVEMITDIAEQTNLLALNASIEAARAGTGSEGGGQGFAVVAEEIRELAERTNDATGKISGLITEIQEKSKEGLNSVDEVEAKVEAGLEVVEETGKVFTDIEQASEQTANQIEQTATATQEMAENSDEVMNAARGIEEMSEGINNSASELAELIQQLEEMLNENKIE